MDTIRHYLDQAFDKYSRQEAVLQAKADLLARMEERYQAYRSEGRTENEAVGQVLAEMGDVDKLLAGLENAMKTAGEADTARLISQAEADGWLNSKRRSARMVAFGVLLCITGAASLILFNYLAREGIMGSRLSEEAGSALGLVPLLILVALAVVLFILSGIRLSKYEFINHDFRLADDLSKELEIRKDQFTFTYTLAIAIGVALCILAPLAVILPSVFFTDISLQLGVVLLLTLVAVAVYMFVYYSTIKDSFDQILRQGEYRNSRPNEETEDRILKAISAVIWPLATIIFLLAGFLGSYWHIAWIVFPITGIFYGMFCAVYSAVKKDK